MYQGKIKLCTFIVEIRNLTLGNTLLFNLFTQNIGGLVEVDSFSPVIDYMRKTLSACGHDVTVEYGRIHSDGINLLFEDFRDKDFCQAIANMRREKGMRFGIIATELMQIEGFPDAGHGISYTGATDQEVEITRRLDGFAEIVKSVDFIWSFLQRTADYHSNSIAISEWFPVGHVMDFPSKFRRSPKNFDICFFGKSTPHRKSVIDFLTDSGLQVVALGSGFPPLGFCPMPLLGSVLDQSKIALNLPLLAKEDVATGTDPRTVSCMRVLEYFQRNLLVVSENIPFDNPYKDVMETAPIAELPDLCNRLLKDGNWDDLGKQKGKKFRETMNAQKMCNPVIERTLTALGLEGK